MDVFIVIINKQFHESFDITYFNGKIKEAVKNLIVFFLIFFHKKFLKIFPKIMVFFMRYWVVFSMHLCENSKSQVTSCSEEAH